MGGGLRANMMMAMEWGIFCTIVRFAIHQMQEKETTAANAEQRWMEVMKMSEHDIVDELDREIDDEEALYDAIERLDVEVVKHGRWIEQTISGEQTWCCSACKTLGSPHWKRCPVCEAKMCGGKDG